MRSCTCGRGWLHEAEAAEAEATAMPLEVCRPFLRVFSLLGKSALTKRSGGACVIVYYFICFFLLFFNVLFVLFSFFFSCANTKFSIQRGQ